MKCYFRQFRTKLKHRTVRNWFLPERVKHGCPSGQGAPLKRAWRQAAWVQSPFHAKSLLV